MEIGENITPKEVKNLATNLKNCQISNLITINKKSINFLHREHPIDQHDSGWRFLSGEEGDDYIENPENITTFNLNSIIDIDPDVMPLLNAPYCSAFERDQDTGEFVESFGNDPIEDC